MSSRQVPAIRPGRINRRKKCPEITGNSGGTTLCSRGPEAQVIFGHILFKNKSLKIKMMPILSSILDKVGTM